MNWTEGEPRRLAVTVCCPKCGAYDEGTIICRHRRGRIRYMECTACGHGKAHGDPWKVIADDTMVRGWVVLPVLRSTHAS
jgi:Zn ribbon nucleic-acid-binding protein